MKHRKLRIAWSVGWGIAVVVLCVLWVRSYRYLDLANLPVPMVDSVLSNKGFLEFHYNFELNATGWKVNSQPSLNLSSPWYEIRFDAQRQELGFPHWLPCLLFVIFATFPWLTRFPSL